MATPQGQRKTPPPAEPVIFQKILQCHAADRANVWIPRANRDGLLELTVVLSGQGYHRVFDREIPCKAGDIYLVPPHIPHDFFSTEQQTPLTVRCLYFDPCHWLADHASVPDTEQYCYGVFQGNAMIAYAMLNAETQITVTALLDHIALETSSGRPAWQDAVRAYLSLLLITVGRYVGNAIQSIPRLRAKDRHIAFAALCMVNEQFCNNELTLERIANSLYVSKSHLSRLFQCVLGRSFSEYLKNLRLNHACKLLSESGLTVELIAQQCGIRDVATFYAGFHAHTGMTPHQYRHAHKTQNNQNHSVKGDKIMIILSEISENLQKGRSKLVKEMVQQALDEGSNPEQILNEGLLAGMNIIGEKFKNNEVYVPEVLVAARAMNMGVQVLKPHLVAQGVQAYGKVCLGTVQGDLHDIGKNLVKMMMEGKGLEVVDLGTDVPAEVFEIGRASCRERVCLSV